jgi:microcystin-dependent protein
MANLKIGLDAAVDKNGFIQNYPVGSIVIKTSPTQDQGWLLCDGGYANTADYPELDAHLGTTYGARVGATFRLPPLVYHPTNNPTGPGFPFSTISSEASYPPSFTHNHNVAMGTTSFDGYNHNHNHNTNSVASNAQLVNHSHGSITGTTADSNAAQGFASTRLAGPAGPYASGATAAATSHAHTGGAYNVATQGSNAGNHAHNVVIHNQTNHNHTHNTNMGSLSHIVVSSTIYPSSKQVWFLIKT